jgi:hypothetical protein
MKDIKTEYKREHYYFHRTDPRPDIPFDNPDDRTIESTVWYWVVIGLGAVALVSFYIGLIVPAA